MLKYEYEAVLIAQVMEHPYVYSAEFREPTNQERSVEGGDFKMLVVRMTPDHEARAEVPVPIKSLKSADVGEASGLPDFSTLLDYLDKYLAERVETFLPITKERVKTGFYRGKKTQP